MVASRELGNLRGISEETLQEIDKVHDRIDKYMELTLNFDVFDDEVIASIQSAFTKIGCQLQRLWGFPEDSEYHTLFKKWQFRHKLYGLTYRCASTGKEFTIPWNVEYRQTFNVGSGMIDVGDGYYMRIIGNLDYIGEKK